MIIMYRHFQVADFTCNLFPNELEHFLRACIILDRVNPEDYIPRDRVHCEGISLPIVENFTYQRGAVLGLYELRRYKEVIVNNRVPRLTLTQDNRTRVFFNRDTLNLSGSGDLYAPFYSNCTPQKSILRKTPNPSTPSKNVSFDETVYINRITFRDSDSEEEVVIPDIDSLTGGEELEISGNNQIESRINHHNPFADAVLFIPAPLCQNGININVTLNDNSRPETRDASTNTPTYRSRRKSNRHNKSTEKAVNGVSVDISEPGTSGLSPTANHLEGINFQVLPSDPVNGFTNSADTSDTSSRPCPKSKKIKSHSKRKIIDDIHELDGNYSETPKKCKLNNTTNNENHINGYISDSSDSDQSYYPENKERKLKTNGELLKLIKNNNNFSVFRSEEIKMSKEETTMENLTSGTETEDILPEASEDTTKAAEESKEEDGQPLSQELTQEEPTDEDVKTELNISEQTDPLLPNEQNVTFIDNATSDTCSKENINEDVPTLNENISDKNENILNLTENITVLSENSLISNQETSIKIQVTEPDELTLIQEELAKNIIPNVLTNQNTNILILSPSTTLSSTIPNQVKIITELPTPDVIQPKLNQTVQISPVSRKKQILVERPQEKYEFISVVKRKRGRPKKNNPDPPFNPFAPPRKKQVIQKKPIPTTINDGPKRKRGRPRKKPIFGFQQIVAEIKTISLPSDLWSAHVSVTSKRSLVCFTRIVQPVSETVPVECDRNVKFNGDVTYSIRMNNRCACLIGSPVVSCVKDIEILLQIVNDININDPVLRYQQR